MRALVGVSGNHPNHHHRHLRPHNNKYHDNHFHHHQDCHPRLHYHHDHDHDHNDQVRALARAAAPQCQVRGSRGKVSRWSPNSNNCQHINKRNNCQHINKNNRYSSSSGQTEQLDHNHQDDGSDPIPRIALFVQQRMKLYFLFQRQRWQWLESYFSISAPRDRACTPWSTLWWMMILSHYVPARTRKLTLFVSAPRDGAPLAGTAIRTLNSKLPKDVHKWHKGGGKQILPPQFLTYSQSFQVVKFSSYIILYKFEGLVWTWWDPSCVHKYWAAQGEGEFLLYPIYGEPNDGFLLPCVWLDIWLSTRQYVHISIEAIN